MKDSEKYKLAVIAVIESELGSFDDRFATINELCKHYNLAVFTEKKQDGTDES